ncbi:unnamed protein product [Peniophora sp. CBMAI 1063]|nr:unnamed protein product [Peniophora sp. CBMAI 1063]
MTREARFFSHVKRDRRDHLTDFIESLRQPLETPILSKRGGLHDVPAQLVLYTLTSRVQPVTRATRLYGRE